MFDFTISNTINNKHVVIWPLNHVNTWLNLSILLKSWHHWLLLIQEQEKEVVEEGWQFCIPCNDGSQFCKQVMYQFVHYYIVLFNVLEDNLHFKNVTRFCEKKECRLQETTFFFQFNLKWHEIFRFAKKESIVKVICDMQSTFSFRFYQHANHVGK